MFTLRNFNFTLRVTFYPRFSSKPVVFGAEPFPLVEFSRGLSGFWTLNHQKICLRRSKNRLQIPMLSTKISKSPAVGYQHRGWFYCLCRAKKWFCMAKRALQMSFWYQPVQCHCSPQIRDYILDGPAGRGRLGIRFWERDTSRLALSEQRVLTLQTFDTPVVFPLKVFWFWKV